MFTTNADDMRDERAPLHHQYPGEVNPQSAVLILSCEDKTLTASVNGIIGSGTHMAAWLGRDREFRIPNTLTGQEVADLLASEEVQGLAARIFAGYSEDASGGDRRGILDEDAAKACLELERYCENLDWLGDNVEGLTAAISDDDLRNLAKGFSAKADRQGVYLDFDMVEELTRRREILREALAS